MKSTLARHRHAFIIAQGWPSGTDLENRAARILHSLGVRSSDVSCQHRAGLYRIDVAFVAVKVALELDGPWHALPETAAKDARRDAWLRGQGWLVMRVNDADDDALAEQLCRVVQVARALA